ncbi:hypothetical protein TWF481_008687 [Arthrobotrys musiformis]|uniref:Uncharacterized protein n=1 Tax=Arthrobotrys musiformis TaxID=47236 RepID=A0AAV9W9P6_9PEZI
MYGKKCSFGWIRLRVKSQPQRQPTCTVHIIHTYLHTSKIHKKWPGEAAIRRHWPFFSSSNFFFSSFLSFETKCESYRHPGRVNGSWILQLRLHGPDALNITKTGEWREDFYRLKWSMRARYPRPPPSILILEEEGVSDRV